MDKPGRNDPCYCGSGEKYKKCHMAADKEAENERRRVQDAATWLRRQFLKFAREERFAESFAVALALYWNNLYTIENAEEMSQNEAFRFFDWFVFDYAYGEQPRLIEVFIAEQGQELSAEQRQLLEAWLAAPPASAYELLSYSGQVLHVRDFFNGETWDVFEPAGHGLVNSGDLLLGRLVPVLDRQEFSTVAAYLPQDEIADLAEKMESARASFTAGQPEVNWETFMRRYGYLVIHHALEQAKVKGRPPVAAMDPNRTDQLARRAARQLRKLQR